MFLSQTANNRWKIAFFILSAFILILMPLLSHSYGQTGDEWLQMEYGRDIWNYFMHGDPLALDYSAGNLQHQKQELYGGLFDFGTEILHHWFPSIPHLVLRHFCNALTGAVFMIFTGLLAYRLSRRNWSIGVIALLFMFFSPRIFGEGMNNPKDIPFGAGFIAGVYFFLALLQDYPRRKWQHAAGLALGFAIAFGVRAAGGALQIAYFMVLLAGYYLMEQSFKDRLKADVKMMKNILLFTGSALVLGYITGLLFWPYGLQSPISHPLESLAGMTNRETDIPVLFEGHYTSAHHMPWYYEFKWIFISNPLVIITGFLLFAVLSLSLMKAYGRFVVLFILFGALFPVVYMIYKHSTVYDTWRHVFFVYPFWVTMAAFGWARLGDLLNMRMARKGEPVRERYVWQAVAVLGLVPAMIWMVRTHPNQYVYFNELVGGIRGAYGNYDMDYYQNSGLQAADWIKQQVPRTPGRRLVVTSNMSGYGNYFVGDDTVNYLVPYVRYANRHSKDWDYYVASPRFLPAAVLQQGIWPPQNVVHRIEVDGVPLSVVLKRKSKDGIGANEAYEAKDFPKAIALYNSFLQTDSTDEFALVNYGIALASVGQIDPAIAAIQRATRLQPGSAQFYDLLAQLYSAKGDAASAQQAKGRSQAITAEEAENNPEE